MQNVIFLLFFLYKIREQEGGQIFPGEVGTGGREEVVGKW
jgi:hypothetical protein